MIAVAFAEAAAAIAVADDRRALQLETFIGGASTKLIGAFYMNARGEMSAQRKELEELGLKAPDGYGAEDDVPLSALAGVRYHYDEARQTIDFDAPESSRAPKEYNMRGEIKRPRSAPSSTGLVLNYLLFGGAGASNALANWRYQGASATLDARMFSQLGVFSQTGILSQHAGKGFVAQRLRLDSTWTYKDPDHAATYRAGDTISGALLWTRPVRIGGLQAQRDFAIRPDLITIPLPSISGGAAVPSTVDVYVNNVRTVTQEVSGGPFRLTNLPILTGQGNASVVVRESSGREVTTTVPFTVSSRLLAAGLYDYSVEAGFPRLLYGSQSNIYSRKPAASASARYGVTDSLTLESHAEFTPGLFNGGLGASFVAPALGVFSGALAASRYGSRFGAQLFAKFETNLFGVTLSASTQRVVGDYWDLAAATARPTLIAQLASFQPDPLFPIPYAPSAFMSLLPPRVQDQISAGFPLPYLSGSINIGYANQQNVVGNRVRLLTTSYQRQIYGSSSIYATAYADVAGSGNVGVSLGLSIPFDNDVTLSTGSSRLQSGMIIGAEAMKTLRQEPGSYGWRIRDREGAGQPLRSVGGAYRGVNGRIEGTVMQSPSGLGGTFENEGAVVIAGGDVFLSNRVNDAFAVVDAGASDLEVAFENRPVARTNSRGKALVPTLNAYQANKLSIDPRNLPLNASIDKTEEVVAPTDRSGVVIDFGVRTDERTVTVILNGPNGEPLRAGLRGSTASGRKFVIGYDGRAFVKGAEDNDVLTVRTLEGECRAELGDLQESEDRRPIGPLTCR